MSDIRTSLDSIINLVDYTNSQCSPTALIGAALNADYLHDANLALVTDQTQSPVRAALLLLMSHVDFTVGVCGPFESVSACLPIPAIAKAREALKGSA